MGRRPLLVQWLAPVIRWWPVPPLRRCVVRRPGGIWTLFPRLPAPMMGRCAVGRIGVIWTLIRRRPVPIMRRCVISGIAAVIFRRWRLGPPYGVVGVGHA